MSRPPKPTCKTTNWQAYSRALRQRGSLTVWFDPTMQWEAVPSGRRGRQQAYSDAEIQPCLTLRVLLGLPLRQVTGSMASLLELSGLGWYLPDFSTLSRRQSAPSPGTSRFSTPSPHTTRTLPNGPCVRTCRNPSTPTGPCATTSEGDKDPEVAEGVRDPHNQEAERALTLPLRCDWLFSECKGFRRCISSAH